MTSSVPDPLSIVITGSSNDTDIILESANSSITNSQDGSGLLLGRLVDLENSLNSNSVNDLALKTFSENNASNITANLNRLDVHEGLVTQNIADIAENKKAILMEQLNNSNLYLGALTYGNSGGDAITDAYNVGTLRKVGSDLLLNDHSYGGEYSVKKWFNQVLDLTGYHTWKMGVGITNKVNIIPFSQLMSLASGSPQDTLSYIYDDTNGVIRNTYEPGKNKSSVEYQPAYYSKPQRNKFNPYQFDVGNNKTWTISENGNIKTVTISGLSGHEFIAGETVILQSFVNAIGRNGNNVGGFPRTFNQDGTYNFYNVSSDHSLNPEDFTQTYYSVYNLPDMTYDPPQLNPSIMRARYVLKAVTSDSVTFELDPEAEAADATKGIGSYSSPVGSYTINFAESDGRMYLERLIQYQTVYPSDANYAPLNYDIEVLEHDIFVAVNSQGKTDYYEFMVNRISKALVDSASTIKKPYVLQTPIQITRDRTIEWPNEGGFMSNINALPEGFTAPSEWNNPEYYTWFSRARNPQFGQPQNYTQEPLPRILGSGDIFTEAMQKAMNMPPISKYYLPSIQENKARLDYHEGLVSNNINEISNLKNTVQGLNEPQLLLRKQIYQRNEGQGEGQPLVLENLNTYISDYTNQRPFIGKITGTIHTSQRYSIGGFTADVCYLGGINRMLPRVEYANTTSWSNSRIGLSNITLESEVISQHDPYYGLSDLPSSNNPNGTLTVEFNHVIFPGEADRNFLRYNAYVSIFIKIDTLLEMQDIPLINDEEWENGLISDYPILNQYPEFLERRAIIQDYVAPSLIHQTESVPPLPLQIDTTANFQVSLYSRLKINYLKNYILQNQTLKFLEPSRWAVNKDIFVYQIITDQATYYISTYNDIDTTNKNILFSIWEDWTHNHGSAPFDRVITPYFNSAPIGNQYPTSLVSALLTAQTGIITVSQQTNYMSGSPEKQLIYENSLMDSETWLIDNLKDIGLSDKDLHIFGPGNQIQIVLNDIERFSTLFTVKSAISSGNGFYTLTKDIHTNIFNKTSGYSETGLTFDPFFEPLLVSGLCMWEIVDNRHNLTLKDYLNEFFIRKPTDTFTALFNIFLMFGTILVNGLPKNMLSSTAIGWIKLLNYGIEYLGTTALYYYPLFTGDFTFSFAVPIDLSLLFSQDWLIENNYNSWEEVTVLDFFGKMAHIWYGEKTTTNEQLLKSIRYFATSSMKVGGDYNGVNYGIEVSDPESKYKEIFADNSVVIYPESIEAQDPNRFGSSPAGYNPVLLKFAEEVLGL